MATRSDPCVGALFVEMKPARFLTPALLACCSLFLGTTSGETRTESTPVTTEELDALLIFPSRSAPAVSMSLNDAELNAEIHGVVKEIPVRVGDRVAQGEVVARLDCEHHEIAHRTASSALSAAQSRHEFIALQLENALKLSKKKNISQEELDKRVAEERTSRAELDRLRSDLDAAQLKVRKCEIKASFNAVVIERIASIGEYTVPGTPIVRLLDDENIEIRARVQEQDLQSLLDAGNLDFVSRGQEHRIRLRTVLPLMDTRLKTHEVRLVFVDQKSAPGSTGRLSWQTSSRHIPTELIVRRGDALGIFVVEDNTARFVPLPDASPGQPAPVDLPGDSRVVVDGRFLLRNGDAVSER